MTRETDMLLGDGFGGDSPLGNPESLASAIDGQETLRSPGELELQHHALLDRQGKDSDETELVKEAREFVARARQIGATQEDPRVREHCQSILDYWAIFVYRMAQVEIDSDLLPFDPSLAPSLEDSQFPYRFEEEMGNHAQQMLGWRRLLDECEQDLAGDHLLTVMGEVGAGVHFLVHNLVLPTLRSGHARLNELSGSEQWRYYEVRLGEKPIADLVGAIARQEGHDAQWIAQRENEFHHDRAALSRILDAESERPAVLVFSRFGCLLKASERERMSILENLENLLQDPQQQYYAIATLRRDQIIALSKFGPLEKRLRVGRVLMAFTTAELRHLIEEPARRVGLIFERGLLDQLLIDIQGEPTPLPLLRFTLTRLWKLRERNRITWRAYEQTGAGRPALCKAMDEVYEDLNEEQKKTLRQVLLAMVNLEPDGFFTTAEVSRGDLERICGDPVQVGKVLDKLLQQELVRESSGEEPATFAVAYHALLTSWPPLINWLDEMRVRERFRLRLRQAATLWSERGKPQDLLWQGAMLVQAREEFDQDASLMTNEQDFLHASRSRKRRKQLNRYVAIALIAVSVLAAGIGVSYARQQAERQQQMYGYAVDSLSKGDLPASLLWLDARDNPSGWMTGASDEAEKFRRLARLQLPTLDVLATVEDEKSDAFEDMALSADQRYLAAIHRKKAKQSEAEETTVEIYSLANPAGESRLQTSLSMKDAGSNIGGIAFTEVGSGASEREYLLVGGDRLYAWERDGGAWTKSGVQWSPGSDGPIVSLAVGGDSLVLTVQREQNSESGRLRLWKLTSQSNTGDLQLEALPDLEKLAGKSTRWAHMSSAGHVLAGVSTEGDTVTELIAWVANEAETSWNIASPPEWVPKLANKNGQRLYDWGWTLTDSGNWQRKGSEIRTAAFSPKGDQFATACDDGQVLVWELRQPSGSEGERESPDSERVPVVMPKFETELQLGSSVFDVTFISEDVIITAGRDRTVRIWDVHAAAEIAPRTYHEGSVDHIRFGGSGMIISNTTPILRIWRSEDYKELISPVAVQQIVRSKDNNRVAYVPTKSTPAALDELPNAAVVRGTGIQSTVISPDGNWVFTASKSDPEGDTVLMVWRGAKFEQSIQLSTTVKLAGVPLAAFSPSGDWLAVCEEVHKEGPPRGFLWNLDALTSEKPSGDGSRQEIDLPAGIESQSRFEFAEMVFGRHGDDEILVIVGKEQLVSERQTHGIIFVGVPKSGQNPDALELSRLKIDASGEPNRSFPHEEGVLCVAFSQEGQLLATGDAHDQVKLWRVEKLVGNIRKPSDQTIVAEPTDDLEHSSDVENLAFGPDESNKKQLLATVTSEGEASIWSIIKGTAEVDPNYRLQHDAKILSVAFSPDGRWIITGGADRAVRIWDSEDGQSLGIFRHRGPVVDAWLSGNGEIVTVNRPSPIAEPGQEPPVHVRHWTLSSQPQGELSKEYLEKLAARKVVKSGLDVLRPGDFESGR